AKERTLTAKETANAERVPAIIAAAIEPEIAEPPDDPGCGRLTLRVRLGLPGGILGNCLRVRLLQISKINRVPVGQRGSIERVLPAGRQERVLGLAEPGRRPVRDLCRQ